MKRHWITFEVTIAESVWINAEDTDTEEEIVNKAKLTGWNHLTEGDWETITDDTWTYKNEEVGYFGEECECCGNDLYEHYQNDERFDVGDVSSFKQDEFTSYLRDEE